MKSLGFWESDTTVTVTFIFVSFYEKHNIFHWMVLSMTDIRLNCVNIILHVLAAAESQNAVIHFQAQLLAACLPDGEMLIITLSS